MRDLHLELPCDRSIPCGMNFSGEFNLVLISRIAFFVFREKNFFANLDFRLYHRERIFGISCKFLSGI